MDNDTTIGTTNGTESPAYLPTVVGEERTLSTQEEVNMMLAELKQSAAPIRKAYMQKVQKQKEVKRAVRKRQNVARAKSRRNNSRGR